MAHGETVSRSLLDKPLNQLTEDDISQLTREDCRRYLKEKGMRRPSWNKSQAIQQVISLKTLFETTTDSEATEARKKLHSVRSNSVVSIKETSEPVPYRRQDPPKPNILANPSGQLAADNDSVSPRTTVAANAPVGQMTIFYGGKVIVYDDMPSDKAQALMQLVASSLSVAPSEGNTAVWSPPCHLQSTVKVGVNYHLPRKESHISCEDSHDGPTSREASVQKYREKRKDRFKNKRKVPMPSSAGLDVYINHLIKDKISNEKLNQSGAGSTPKSRPPNMPISSSLVENFSLVSCHSANLDDKGMFEYRADGFTITFLLAESCLETASLRQCKITTLT